MTALGAQCRGERHEQIITRQREALMELRTRVKSLEQVRPPSKYYRIVYIDLFTNLKCYNLRKLLSDSKIFIEEMTFWNKFV